MNSIVSAANGLASSLLLNLGFTRLAEKLDPMLQQSTAAREMKDATSCAFTEVPCHFPAESIIKLVRNVKDCAFTEVPCHFAPEAGIKTVRSVKDCAFTEVPCHFTAESVIKLVRNVKDCAFTEVPCHFTPAGAN